MSYDSQTQTESIHPTSDSYIEREMLVRTDTIGHCNSKHINLMTVAIVATLPKPTQVSKHVL